MQLRHVLAAVILSAHLTGNFSATAQVQPAWVARTTGLASTAARAKAMAVDSAGNVYVTGEMYTGTNFDHLTIKYDRDGNQLWAAQYNGPANKNDQPIALAVDAVGQ